MALIEFWGGVAQNYAFGQAGSGLGFYGSSGFGASVQVGSYQDNTYVTDSTGAIQNVACNNTKYSATGLVILGSASTGVPLTTVPNAQCPTNIRFTHTSAVKTQNAKLIIYDRVATNNAASGVTTQTCQIIHASPIQQGGGSGEPVWTTWTTSLTGMYHPFVASPGSGGFSPNGTGTISSVHDWFALLSASPNSIGSKSSFGAYYSVEYL